MSDEDDLCYLPTRRLCSLNERLDASFFPEGLDDVFKQEIITYKRFDGGIRIEKHIRNFSGGSHYDCQSSEIMLSGVSK
tara:strand:- start:86 stop:322 length:237 start_codon:yes stop_codon:yes gene_type:complete